MTDEKLHEQLERYSNAIVGFVVLQSVAFSFYVGTNELFHRLLLTVPGLAKGLSVHFLVVTVLSLLATLFIAKHLMEASGTKRNILRAIYWGKAVAILVFTAIPVVTLLYYVPTAPVPNR